MLLKIKPHPVAVVLRVLGRLFLLAIGLALLVWLSGRGLSALGLWWISAAIVVTGVLLVTWSALVWASREYILTDRAVSATSGVLRRVTVEAPLTSIRHMVVYRSIRERLTGLGTLGFATAGTDGVEVVWLMIAKSREVRDRVQGAIDGREWLDEAAVPVIGLAGGIGAGKTEVASILGALGCVVIDADKEARAALDLEPVKEELRRWWGERAFTADGRVDRNAVAAIVFGDEQERRRLERLIHPIVRQSRGRAIEEARAQGAPAIVIDAPLLFETGTAAECGHIVFVDAPRELRLQRVLNNRGWDREEFDRRESAQLPADEKRERSDSVIMNRGDRADLEAQVEQVLSRVSGRRGGRRRGTQSND